MRRTLLVVLVIGMLIAPASAAAASARKGSRVSGASCAVNGNVVTATGLPTDQVINLMVTDANGTSGWVLGYTTDGTWTVSVATPTSPTSYEFTGRTYGPNGAKYNVFAACST